MRRSADCAYKAFPIEGRVCEQNGIVEPVSVTTNESLVDSTKQRRKLENSELRLRDGTRTFRPENPDT